MKKYYRYLRSGILPFACLLLFVHLGNHGLIIQITDPKLQEQISHAINPGKTVFSLIFIF